MDDLFITSKYTEVSKRSIRGKQLPYLGMLFDFMLGRTNGAYKGVCRGHPAHGKIAWESFDPRDCISSAWMRNPSIGARGWDFLGDQAVLSC